MQLKTFILHFILGGTIVSVVTFIGSQGKGMLAAFVATFPTMTALTFALVYSKAGQVATVNYAKGLLLMTPPWIIYVLCLIFLLPKWGFVKSLIAGVLGFILGVALSYPVAYIAENIVSSFITEIRQIDLLWVFGATVFMSLIAAYIPMKRIFSIDPAEVFKN